MKYPFGGVLFLSFVSLAGLVCPAQQNPTSGRYSIDQVREMALAQPSAYSISERDTHIAEQDVKQSQASFLPIIAAPLSYTFTSPLRGPDQAGVPFADRPPGFIANDSVHHYTLFAEASGEIDVNGKLKAALDRSRAALARAKAQALVARRGVLTAVTEAYYAAAFASAERRVDEETLASAESFLHVAELRVAAGEAPQVDTLKARTDVAARTDELLQAKAAELEAADTVRVLAGIPFDAPFEADPLELTTPDGAALQQFTSSMVKARPEFSLLDAEENEAAAEIRLARAERRPTLSYSIVTGIDDSTIAPKRDFGVAAAVTLSIPLFDWGASRSRQFQAELRRESVRETRVLLERGLSEQFRAARIAVETAIERVNVLSASVKDAERALDISRARYEAGEAAVIEVFEARAAASAQRMSYFTALRDYRVALNRLEEAAGK